MKPDLFFIGNINRGLPVLKGLIKNFYSDFNFFVWIDLTQDNVREYVDFCDSNNIRYKTSQNPFLDISKIPLKEYKLTIIAGYSKIIPASVIQQCNPILNLHGGKLPEFRGSSPLNWALAEGAKEITLSITRVTALIDSGDIIEEATFALQYGDNISSLHKKSNEIFLIMLNRLLPQLLKGKDFNSYKSENKTTDKNRYFPLRSPSDSIILWDLQNHTQVLNLIKASGHPYQGAIAYLDDVTFRIYHAEEYNPEFRGSPGKLYKIFSDKSFLVCCADRCIRITEYETLKKDKECEVDLSTLRYRRFESLITLIKRIRNER